MALAYVLYPSLAMEDWKLSQNLHFSKNCRVKNAPNRRKEVRCGTVKNKNKNKRYILITGIRPRIWG